MQQGLVARPERRIGDGQRQGGGAHQHQPGGGLAGQEPAQRARVGMVMVGHGRLRTRDSVAGGPTSANPCKVLSEPGTRDGYRIGGDRMQPSPAAQLAMA